MIASHPDLLVTPECGFSIWLANEFSAKDCTNRKVRALYADRVFVSRKFDTWNIGLEELKTCLRLCNATSYSELAEEVYHCYGKLVAKKRYSRWGDKNNFYLNCIEEISKLYPEAQFIHIIRDGRDVACSYREINQRNLSNRFSPDLPVDLEDIAKEWKQNVMKVRCNFEKIKCHQKYEIRFSDLVKNTESTLTNICHFLGVNYSNLMLDYHLLNAQNKMEPPELMQWKENTLSKPIKNRVGRYRQDLSPEEIYTFEQIADDVLKLYSFPL